MATHDPYIPIKETFKSFDITPRDFKKVKEFLLNVKKYSININMKAKRLSKRRTKILQKLYDASVYYADLIIKYIISILKRLDLLKNSYIIITSDHGEHLCDKKDHFMWGHQNCLSLYKPLMRVPLIIYHTNFKKRIVKNQVQLKDLFHTILHLTGIPSIQNKYLNLKKSILYQIDNNSSPKYIFGEHLKAKTAMTTLINDHHRKMKKRLIPKITNHLYFVRSNQYKYIRYNKINIEEFYNLSNDPDEQNNILEKNNESYRKMKIYLEEFISKNKNWQELKALITEKEKDMIKSIIGSVKGV